LKNKSAILGAAFLMATSAIGPGFLTQTTKFNADLLALAVILLAASKKKIVDNYHHPSWMLPTGWLVVLLMNWMGFITIRNSLPD
jgi:Mn2+/Fe2+ NRAMP family transporter